MDGILIASFVLIGAVVAYLTWRVFVLLFKWYIYHPYDLGWIVVVMLLWTITIRDGFFISLSLLGILFAGTLVAATSASWIFWYFRDLREPIRPEPEEDQPSPEGGG